MEVIYGTVNDIEPWMELVGSVSRNFPGLETEESIDEHRKTVLKFMEKAQALCVKAVQNRAQSIVQKIWVCGGRID